MHKANEQYSENEKYSDIVGTYEWRTDNDIAGIHGRTVIVINKGGTGSINTYLNGESRSGGSAGFTFDGSVLRFNGMEEFTFTKIGKDFRMDNPDKTSTVKSMLYQKQ